MTEPFQSRTPLRFARGELVFGYRLVRKLGEGSFGTVWLAANEKGFEWALKFVNLHGNGGLKEFKALQLIKDRKINNTNLLKLIDYGLLDHDGNSLATSTSSPLLGSTPQPKSASAAEAHAEPAVPHPAPGTIVPVAEKAANRTEVEQLAARETQGDPSDTKTVEKNRASWLVIVMEVGQSTLHQLQMQQTQRDLADYTKRPRAVTRMGVTAGNSHTVKDGGETTPLDPAEEPLSPLPTSLVLPYMEQAARGLDYLHRHDIVHRDIKPQNIILVGDDAKLCDYGLASEFTNSTATTIGCTPAYAAPEAINNRPVPASDQYSLAVTYIELVTGRWPFFGITQTAIYREKDEGKHNLAFIPKRRVRDVLKRALAKHSQDRYSTCSEFMQKLAAAENSAASYLPPVQVLATACVLLVVVAATLGWMYQSGGWIFGRANGNQISHRESLETPQQEIPAGEPDPGVQVPAVNPAIPAASPSVDLPSSVPVQASTPTSRNPQEELTAAFANTSLPIRELLQVIETSVHATSDPAQWFDRLKAKANLNPASQAAVEQWLHKNVNRSPRPAGLNSPEYQQFDQDFRAASLQRLGERTLNSASELEAALKSDSLKLSDANPFAILLRVDLEQQLAGATATKTQRDDWDGRIQSAMIPALAGQRAEQRELFVTYLNGVQFATKPSEFEFRELSERLQTLLNASPQPTWLTTQRKQRLATPLGMLAIRELGKQDADLLEIERWKLESNQRLQQLLTIAELHGLQSESLAAAQALLRASQALQKKTSEAEWKAISELAKAGYHDTPTNEFLISENCRLLLYYVVQRAAIESAPAQSKDFRDAVKGFAALLQAKQGDTSRYFDFASENQSHDVSVLRHLVQPASQHVAVAADANAEQFDAASMAFLWAAHGRLLQRNFGSDDFLEPATKSKLSKRVQSLLVAHQDLERANRLDQIAANRDGKPRTRLYQEASASVLAELSKVANSQSTPLADLIAIVDVVDPRGTASEAEMLRLGGFVRRQQASLETEASRRKEFAAQAISRYGQAISLMSKDNRQAQLAPLCSELGELHLQLAEGIELQRVDYDPIAEQSVQPPQGTKSFHLWRAAGLAKQALSVANAQDRTSASLILANAYEQMAFALGLVSNYDRAIAILDGELGQLPAAAPEKNLVLANRARCRLRQAQEMFSGIAREESHDLLLAAQGDFEAALADRRTTKQWLPADADTLYFLGENQIALASHEETDRTQRLNQAEAALRTAIEAAAPASLRLSHYRWRLLLVMNSQAISSSRAAQKFADEVFVASGNPALQEPAAINGIALTTARLFPEPSKLLRWLPASGPWHQQWRTTDAWKLEGARLYSEAALLHSSTDLRRSAQQLALEIPASSPQRLLAEASLQDSLARQLCREFERMKPPSSTQLENQQRSYDGDRLAKAGIATAAIRDCCQKHWTCQEERIQQLLNEIENASLADLQAGKCLTNSTVLDKRALWKFVTSSPSLDSRERYLEMCSAHAALLKGDAVNRAELDETTQALIKPAIFFASLTPHDARLQAFLQKHKTLVEGETKKK